MYSKRLKAHYFHNTRYFEESAYILFAIQTKVASHAADGIKAADNSIDAVKSASNIGEAISGATFEGRLYRSVGPDKSGMLGDPLDIHAGNIATSHRYTQPGTGGLYFSTGEKIVNAELNTWGVASKGRVMHAFDVKIDNLLDVSNPSTRRQLGVTLEDIIGDSYDVTHKIGEFAKTNGFSGIIAPSARADGGLNIIIFNGKLVK